MKRMALIGLAVLSVIGAAHAADTDAGIRTFNSQLPLDVYIVRTLDGDEERVGATPSETPLEIPECQYWWVKPRGRADMDKLSQEVLSKRIPGLELSNATDDDLAHLKGLTGLRMLNLSETTITDVGLAHLKGLTGLQRLSLDDTHITDTGLAHLKGMTGLRALNLWGTNITDAGLAHLKGLTGLQRLSLDDTHITDTGLAHLKGMTGLRALNLWGTNIT
ncbi:MAG TPA: hypothetical protein ENH78_06435, partial [Phycisphaerae bacterium]|nr:hypothetical protein [Phycisphaerae bacterium]